MKWKEWYIEIVFGLRLRLRDRASQVSYTSMQFKLKAPIIGFDSDMTVTLTSLRRIPARRVLEGRGRYSNVEGMQESRLIWECSISRSC